MRVAAAAYPCEFLASWSAYEDKLAAWIERAAAGGAQLLVFPEWAGLELATLAGPRAPDDHAWAIDAQTERLGESDALVARLAATHGVYVCTGTAMVRERSGEVFNRARLITPQGAIGTQDKLIMTRYEREVLHIEPGRAVHVFETALGRVGIAICYDVEFPLIARAMVEAGAALILSPSCTEAAAGYWRVRIGAQARALEGQCVTVQSPTIGRAEWSEAIDVTTGAAGIYAPPDRGFPSDGVLATGAIDEAGWVFADVDLDMVAQVRRDGGVLNMQHWSEQHDGRLAALSTIDLRVGSAAR
jgi:predicted amidohydrolase